MASFFSPLFVVNSTLTAIIIILSFLNYKKSQNKVFLYLFIFFILLATAYLFDYLNLGNIFSLFSITFKIIGYLLLIQFLHAQLIYLNNNKNNNNNNLSK